MKRLVQSSYIPEDVTFSQQAQYGELSLVEALSSVTGGFIWLQHLILTKVVMQTLRLGLNYLGYVFNPQEQVMFEGIPLENMKCHLPFHAKVILKQKRYAI
jgi:hypothetical protein